MADIPPPAAPRARRLAALPTGHVGLVALLIALLVIVAVYTTRVAAQSRTAIGAEEVT